MTIPPLTQVDRRATFDAIVLGGGAPGQDGIGLETVGVEPDPHGIRVDDHLRAGQRLWAVGAAEASYSATTRRACVPLEVLSDTIQPFPIFSGLFDLAPKAPRMEVASMPPPARPDAGPDGPPMTGRRPVIPYTFSKTLNQWRC